MWVLTRGKIEWPGTIDWSYIDICRYIYSFHFSLPMGYSPLLGKSYREGKRHSQQTDTSTDHNKGSSGVLYKANEEGKLQACCKASCKRSFELSLNYWKIRKGKGISGKSNNVYDSTKARKNETIEWWLLWDEYIVDGLRGTGRQEEGQEERQESRWNLCLRSGCVWSLTTSPRSLELLSRVMSSVECARTRADMLCILEICSGLGNLISYFNLTAPVAFIYNKLLRGCCWFSLFLHCPFCPIPSHSALGFHHSSEAVCVRITQCRSNGCSFICFHSLLNSNPHGCHPPFLVYSLLVYLDYRFVPSYIKDFCFSNFFACFSSLWLLNVRAFQGSASILKISLQEASSTPWILTSGVYVDESQIYVSSPCVYTELQTHQF